MASWHGNVVRIPLNEDCWLGINGVKPTYGGASYRKAILDYVDLLHHYGIYAELSLMWAAPGGYKATYQPAIAIPCIDYANMCGVLPNGSKSEGSTWLESRPSDPDHQLIAEAHVYRRNLCDTVACLNSSVLPVTKSVPLIFGETGEIYDGSDCGASFISTFLNWADANDVGYEAWTWDAWSNCFAQIGNTAARRTPATAGTYGLTSSLAHHQPTSPCQGRPSHRRERLSTKLGVELTCTTLS